MAVLFVFLLLSGWSATQGVARLLGSSEAAEPVTRTSKEGSVEVQLTLLNLKDPPLEAALVFDLAMNSMDMSAPSFQTLYLRAAITLQIDGGTPVLPAEVQVSDWGHMGHHVRGRVVFSSRVAGAPVLESRLLQVTLRGIGGVDRRVLEWRLGRAGR